VTNKEFSYAPCESILYSNPKPYACGLGLDRAVKPWSSEPPSLVERGGGFLNPSLVAGVLKTYSQRPMTLRLSMGENSHDLWWAWARRAN